MSAEKNKSLDVFMAMLEHLSDDEKLELIALLSQSLRMKKKSRKKEPAEGLNDLYGAWKDEKSAEELIAELRQSRVFTRQIEPL